MLFSCARLLSARWPGAGHQVVSCTCLDQTRPGIRWSSRTPNKSRKIRRSLPIAMYRRSFQNGGERWPFTEAPKAECEDHISA
jgi:hypothetical protein